VRRACAGEFTARAYLSGRLTLEQSEGVAATIAAQTEAQLAAARSLLSGRMGASYRALADRASGLLALVEAGVDFTDQEDVVAITPGDARREIASLMASLDGLLVGVRGGEHRETRAVVVLMGRPNAGKSTLFNALLGRRRSVESPIAGTTRDAIDATLDLSKTRPGSGEVTLVDLPGLEEAGAGGGVAQAAQGAARRALARCDAVVYCDPEGVFEEATPERTPVVRVRTFADRARRGGAAGVTEGVIEVCALDGHGLDELRRRIGEVAVASVESGVAGLVPRHRSALAGARRSLDEGLGVVGEPELLAEALRGAVSALGEIVGRIDPDEILGKVFSQFCIGK
jgi:tRNA modification GTPase